MKMERDTDTKVIIADSQFLIVESLRRILSETDGYNLYGTAGSKEDLYTLLQGSGKALLITDPQSLDFCGVEELRKIRNEFSDISILILTHTVSKSEYVELRKAGLNNIVFKTAGRDELFTALEATLKGKKYFTPDLLDLLVENGGIMSSDEESRVLTQSEIEIVRMIAGGYTTKEIALKRHISVHTVNTHRKNIFRKLRVSSVSELIMQAIRSGWIDGIEYYI